MTKKCAIVQYFCPGGGGGHLGIWGGGGGGGGGVHTLVIKIEKYP